MSTGLKRAFAWARAQYSIDNLRSTEHLRRLTIVSVTVYNGRWIGNRKAPGFGQSRMGSDTGEY